jgi:hypothetical protein
MESKQGAFIVELTTRQGRVCERYTTYAEARQRVEQFPADSLVSMAFIFQELPDGSERLVREDGKALQFHRRLVDEAKDSSDEPLPLVEPSAVVGPEGGIRLIEAEPPDVGWEDGPMA